jgi:UDP-3-O-[3-hydroxymyristoyl] glucosamine N-acyltransferase
MSMTDWKLTVDQLGHRLGGTVEGDGSVEITGVAGIAEAGPGELTFADARRAGRLAGTGASAAIVERDCPPAPLPLIRVDSVEAAVADLLDEIAPPEDLPPAGRHPSAVVADTAEVDPSAAIGPCAVVGERAKIAPGAVLSAGTFVGAGASVGEETVLYPGTVVLAGCRVGRRCRIGPNAAIGSSGFGYHFADGRHRRIAHAGGVEIGDDVDMGACSCVDRSKFGATRIGDGCKFDNHVQVAHNVQMGRHCVVAAATAVGGSVRLGDYTVIGGHVGVRDNLTIGTGARIGAYSGVGEDVPDGESVLGVPAGPGTETIRIWRHTRRLPEMHRAIRSLEKRLEAIESATDHPGTR